VLKRLSRKTNILGAQNEKEITCGHKVDTSGYTSWIRSDTLFVQGKDEEWVGLAPLRPGHHAAISWLGGSNPEREASAPQSDGREKLRMVPECETAKGPETKAGCHQRLGDDIDLLW